ncbi:glutathione S-transferase N-terminal domain-containing protein [Shimia thalassica]|jgi:GST-like protein|uniref:glutathione binding-like protein n=1 Tax=Shimia thalassica TaxID=1715693 RepID=UPI000C08088B|nr:glutathione binding-like protein [Shimia thalassica]PHO04697.1 glutathione S-transferase [Rhodobacteraceae bacterium 4F10]MBU2943315.1 glutathione S-transferase N-terminal domain-containing protein [Shimia thalassica]MDO6478883.1 glutathione S-transferase N-terminal domain-containing protein [Shimia thalassica]MDO6501384.1 glutathione S-transferase N-terminal domain-containing protein [Shimia thalassica]MDO6521975.1 glutathione S-transferase N-terminal domain-containing protein [Shimia thal
MKSVTEHPINGRWPAANPEVLQLYSFPTPNGVKVSIMLEEIGLPYEAHKVGLSDADVKSPEFLSLNPNNKIPAIFDPNGPDGSPVALFESGAILLYLGEKTGKLVGSSASEKAVITQWLMFQMGGVGPMFGQMGFFTKFAGSEIEDPRPRERYIAESKRLLAVIEKQLEGQDWIAGEYSIADIAIAPWLKALAFYEAEELLGLDSLPNVQAYIARFSARPAVQRGASIPPRD